MSVPADIEKTGMAASAYVLLLVIILLLLAALVVAWRPATVAALALARGDGSALGNTASQLEGASALGGASQLEGHPAPLPFETALERRTRELDPEEAPRHPLDRTRYEGAATHDDVATHDAVATGGARGPPAPKKPWTQYATWAEMYKDLGAFAEYSRLRADVMTSPKQDWTAVLAEIRPYLDHDREYIGVINLDPDGRTLRIAAFEASPTGIGEGDDEGPNENYNAGIPEKIVAKYENRPALYLFHTHPNHPRSTTFPSSIDLASSIRLSANMRFAGDVVISRHGAMVVSLSYTGYKSVHAAKNVRLALANLVHDVVAAHEAVRSWSLFTIDEYFQFYPRHRLTCLVFPTAEMVADSHQNKYETDLESPVDHELMQINRDEMMKSRSDRKSRRRGY